MTRAAPLVFLVAALSATPALAVTPGTVCNDKPRLGYMGNGPLIQKVKVVDVFYSPGHKYKSQLEDFYKAILQSAHFDWLVEYNVTNYKIGRGSFAATFEDTNPNPTTVQTIDPEMYLKGLVTAGKVPPPDDDTLYMMYFPSGIDPSDGSGSSCIKNGDYCAYHYSYQATNGQNVRYGVIPDMEAGGCNQGCGPPGFDSFTDVSSHELIEAVTDPDGTGWYDVAVSETSQDNCGEIGDICAVGGLEETATIDGFKVQKEWSNKNNACIGTDPNVVANDFTLAASPTQISVPIGGSAPVTVTLTKKSGMAENVALTATASAATLTASFNPASVSSDTGTSTMTVSASPTAVAGTPLTITVKATGSTVSYTATVNVTVVPAVDMVTSGGGGSGGNGDHGGGGGGCSVAGGLGGRSLALGGGLAGPVGWACGLVLLALALHRRRA